MHLSEAKANLRESIKERISKIPPKQRVAEERSLRHTLEQILGTEPKTIAAYVPLKDEADIRPLLTDLLTKGWKIFLPCFSGGKLAFRITDTVDDLQKGPLGISEPPQNAESLKPGEVEIVLVPGRAFTKDGTRLGRGNGGYDIWIHTERARNPKLHTIGIALECQVLAEIPTEAHDERVDQVVTARGAL